MKKTIITLLGLISLTLAVPLPQQDNLDNLISNVFGRPPSSTAPPGSLNDLINNVFPRSSTTVKPVLGIDNQAPKTNADCECVPYYQCRNGTVLTDGIGIIDIRSNFGDGVIDVANGGFDGPCVNYLDVCCKAPNLINNTKEIVTPKPELKEGCGNRHPKGVGFRITGATDNEAQFGEFPWMVAILKEEVIGSESKKLNIYQCGGSLIHRKAVLTAAHCVNGIIPSKLRIRAGEWDTQTSNEIYPHQDRNVEKIVMHKDFHSGALYNDIAVLILTEPVELAENVDIVCLPEQGTSFDGSRCFASGWGKDIFGKEGHYQVILKKVEVPVVPRDVCQETLRQTRLGKYFTLDRTFICAGGENGKDTCKGDGGGPLVCPIKNSPNHYAQAGIVAWGIGCGQDGTPGVYVNVAELKHWVDEQIAFNNLDNTVYQHVS